MATQYTSGVSTFNLDLNNLVEEAYERCGLELRSGYDLRTARRSMNIMTIEWANRGINLWTIEELSIPLVGGQPIYALPTNTIDILDAVTRTSNANPTNQQDINISRISESTYSTIPNKLTTGRPIQMWVNRQSGNADLTSYIVSTTAVTSTATTITLGTATNATPTQLNLPSTGFIQLGSEIIAYTNIVGNQLQNCWRAQNGTTAAGYATGTAVYQQYLPCINVWPTPSSGSSYTFVAWRMRRVQDAGDGGTFIQDIPFRWIPPMVSGLAFYISLKKPDVDPNRVQMLKADYEQQFDLAAQEDRDKASDRFVPRNLFYSR